MSSQPSESFPLQLCVCRETDGGSCEEGEGGDRQVFANDTSRERTVKKKYAAGKGGEAGNMQAASKLTCSC